jgi:cytidylate kinase
MDPRQNFIVTIDGPAGVGKSTLALALSKRLDAVFLDTGAMERGIDPADTLAVRTLFDRCRFEFHPRTDGMQVLVDSQDKTVTIRDPHITEQVKYVACATALREKLVKMQEEFAAGCQRIVTEGRDQGTVVFPHATVKFFLTADPQERARRRHRDLAAAGKDMALETVLEQQTVRDASDENRSVGPLKPATDAVMIDTTTLSVEQVLDQMQNIIREKTGGR